MPSAFTHAFSAIALGYSFKNDEGRNKLMFIGSLCSALPDFDAISFQFGIPYSSMWGHRGISHSFFFAFILALVVMAVFYRRIKGKKRIKYFFYFFIATSLHPLLDALTNGGLGVAFFAPFNNERYFFPFTPIKVSPISISRFFTERGLEVFKSELKWVWFPASLLMSIFFLKRRIETFRKNDF